MTKMILSAAIIWLSAVSYAKSLPTGVQEDGRWYFTHYTTSEGLSFNNINAIEQDAHGFMWFATENGLSRYDGRSFKNFHKKELGLDTDFITALCADKEGNLWVGTDNGLSLYSYLSDCFIAIRERSDIGTTINGKVTHICTAEDGKVWISVNGLGLFSCDKYGRELKNHFCKDGRSCLPANIRTFVIDNCGDFWFSLYFADLWHSDKDLKEVRKIEIDGWKANDDIMNIGKVFSGNKLIISSWQNGLCEYDIRKNSFRRLLADYGGGRPKAMFLDGNVNIWIATNNGLIIYDIDSGKTRRINADNKDKFSIANNNIMSVYVDNADGLWIGTSSSGLNYANGYHRNFKKYYMADGESIFGTNVMDIAADDKGNIWAATMGDGLLKLDKRSGKLSHYKSALLPKSLRSVCYADGYVWTGTGVGIFRLRANSGEIRAYRQMKDNVHRIFRSSKGEILACTTLGLMRYDSQNDCFSYIKDFNNLYITDISETKSGDLWVSTYANGIYRYSTDDKEITAHYGYEEIGNRHISVDKFTCIYTDSRGNIWAGCYGEALLKYDQEKDGFYSYEDGNKFDNCIVFSMTEDNNANMWVATSKGIASFNNEEFRFYTTADGLLDDLVEGHTALVTASGHIYFSSNNGFISFKPEEFFSTDRVPPIVLSDLSINNKVVKPGKDSPLSVNINETEQIRLSHRENSFSISISLLSLDSPANNERWYFLDAYDEEWQKAEGAGIQYNNLPPGEYTLYVKGVDSNGIWNESHAPLRIVVQQSIFKTPTAIALYILLGICLIAGVVVVATKSATERERKKQNRLKIIREQEVFHEKISFFYNIIHEIKTPLTLIKAPLQNIISKGDLSQDSADDLSVIRNNTDYLDKLIKELLDFVRIEENGWVLEYRKLNLIEKLNFLCFNFRDTVHSRNLKLEFEHEEDKLDISVDEPALLKILNNLLHNATKYAETYINICAYKDGEFAVVSISNDGPAIPEERREKIFKPFVQYSAEHQPYSQSFGIGLALARTLANMHGGSLELGDDSDCTKFILRLPLNNDKFAEQERVGAVMNDDAENDENQKEEDRQKTTLLVVEDNDDLSDFLARKLSSEYKVIAVPSAERALETLKDHDIDIVLTDIALAGMSGIELCKRISTDFEYSHIPIIVLSAISSVSTKISCMENGASLYIEKPFSLDYLMGSIAIVAKKRHQFKEQRISGLAVSRELGDFNIATSDKEFIVKVDKLIMENLSDPDFGNDELAACLCISKSTLTRKAKGLLGVTPNDYIRSKRLNIAAEMLSSNNCRINEVCYSVGFNTPSYFTKCFKKQFGMQPAEYMKMRTANSSNN